MEEMVLLIDLGYIRLAIMMEKKENNLRLNT